MFWTIWAMLRQLFHREHLPTIYTTPAYTIPEEWKQETLDALRGGVYTGRASQGIEDARQYLRMNTDPPQEKKS